MDRSKTILVTLGLLFSISNSSIASSFVCDVEPTAQKKFGHLRGNAGCIVIENNRLLVVENRTWGNRISPPAGTAEKGESAQCTAARETFEESTAKVKVHELLHRFENDFSLFRCELKNKELSKLTSIPIPPPFHTEIRNALWVDVQNTRLDRWRYPDQLPILQKIALELTQKNKSRSQSFKDKELKIKEK